MQFFENHYCFATKLHTLIMKYSQINYRCTRCLTEFSSKDILNDHNEKGKKQQPTIIDLSWKQFLMFDEFLRKIPVPIRVYEDFEWFNHSKDNHKVLVTQLPIAACCIKSPFGNHFDSYFGTDFVNWFVDRLIELEKLSNMYLNTKRPLQETPGLEVQLQEAKVCWLREEAFSLDCVKIKFEIITIQKGSTEEQLIIYASSTVNKKVWLLLLYFSHLFLVWISFYF